MPKERLWIVLWLGLGLAPWSVAAETYQISPDDMLNTISLKLYGSSRYGLVLAEANGLKHSGPIKPGQVLHLPEQLRSRRIPLWAGELLLLDMWRKRLAVGLEEQNPPAPNGLFDRPAAPAVPVIETDQKKRKKVEALIHNTARSYQQKKSIPTDPETLLAWEQLVKEQPTYCSLKFVRVLMARVARQKGGANPCGDSPDLH